MSSVVIKGNASGTGSVTIESPNTNSDYTVILPAASGTLGAGDVTGPASATDNAVARFDGTTGKLIQNSAVTIADDGTTVISVSSSSDALRITQVGDGNALVVEDSTSPDSTPFVIDADGRVVVGNTVPINATAATEPYLQVHGTNAGAQLEVLRFGANVFGDGIVLAKSRGALGVNTIVSSGDTLGNITYRGADGTGYLVAASISAAVDGTPGTSDMPGRLVFSTTADGASTPTERMRIDSSGNLRFNSGYGSVAIAYGCRAWVNFDGTTNVGGNCTIRASGNVSTVADNGTGDYTVNFTAAMPDNDYSAISTAGNDNSTADTRIATANLVFTTSSIRLQVHTSSARLDRDSVCVTIFR